MKIENLRQQTNERMNMIIYWAPYRAIKPLIMVQFQLSYLANVELSSLLWWGKNFNLDKASPYYFNSSYFFITFLPGNKNILTFTSRLGNKINLSLDTFIVLLHNKTKCFRLRQRDLRPTGRDVTSFIVASKF